MKMKLTSCHIENFRSIRDTKPFNLSLDNITCIIGQNESGKTSILEALHSFGTGEMDPLNFRPDGTLPIVRCAFKFDDDYLPEKLQGYGNAQDIVDFFKSRDNVVWFERLWDKSKASKTALGGTEQSFFSEIAQKLQEEKEKAAELTQAQAEKEAEDSEQAEPVPSPSPEIPEDEIDTEYISSANELHDILLKDIPHFELFDQKRGLLPNEIDLGNLEKKKGEGYKGAENFLKVAGFSLENYQSNLKQDTIRTEYEVETLSQGLTKDLRDFWAQHVGKNNKIQIQFAIKNYDEKKAEENGAKPGDPYIIFWVKDRSGKLHPTQRSEGVRWFLSFYFQLKASSKNPGDTIFLIDEPGRSLHEIAQNNVLKLFSNLDKNVQIIYTTHSPHLIDEENPFRVIAAQRSMEEELSDTQVLIGHDIGGATSDTLSPLLILSGVDVTRNAVISKTGNVILEEISAFYYVKAFQKLHNIELPGHFLPATGVSQLLKLVYLLIGWKVEFAVMVDGDREGNQIHEELKMNLYNNDAQETNKSVYRLRGYEGIEDIFTKTDFMTHILKDSSAEYKSEESNSKYVKRKKLAKGYLAARFFRAVRDGEITAADMNKGTMDNALQILEKLKELVLYQTQPEEVAEAEAVG